MTKEQVNKVMLIDDNSTDRFIHTKLLEIYSIGKEVQEFDSGSEALKYLKENKEKEEMLPDVVLLDVLMPEMSGFDFLVYFEQFYAELAKKPALFMLSSTDDEQDLKKAHRSQIVQRMLRKPFSPDALVKALGELKL